MKNFGDLTAGVAFLTGIIGLLFFCEISDFPMILLFYSLAFVGYIHILRRDSHINNWIAIAWLLRITALFAFPGLSDDIYRFIWDGWQLTEGNNPFTLTPSAFQEKLSPFHQFLLNEMNSPDYYSVYPPVLQGIFAFTSWLVPANIFWQSFVLKLIMLAFEIITYFATVKLLHRLAIKKAAILIYLLNPLIIVELMGNLHMELIMISFFALFLGAFAQKNYSQASIFLSFSVASKLLTLLASPFLLKRMNVKLMIKFFLLFGLCMAVLFLPMFLSTYENFGKGLDLYFQKFEFNASFYFIFRSIGFWYKGYNIIASLGPMLAGVSTIVILLLAYREKAKTIGSLCTYLILALSVYFFLSTTVHPWYLALLVYLSIFSKIRYPILWSFLAVLSYSKYGNMGEEVYLVLVGLEYLLVFIFILLEYKARVPQFLKTGLLAT